MSPRPVSPERWRTLEPLLDRALALPTSERRAFLESDAAGDPAQREELARMVADCEQTGGLLERPAAERFAALWSERADLESLRADLAARYTVEHELGRGGMGTVYRAIDLRHDRPVALKLLHDVSSAVLGAERFRREIATAARLQHPHILPVFDSGEAAGRLWYTMPLVAGETLRDRLAREPQMPLDESVRIVRALAAALGHAHAQGVVHRDVKPENVLLGDGEGHVLLADFGIARTLETGPGAGRGTTLTGAGVSLGTPAYMSPEQAAGSPDVDGRTDLYSLGAVLYEMLAGGPLYTGPNAQALMARHALDPIPSLRVVRPGVPAAVERAIHHALAKVPADRVPTAAAFADALAAAVRAADAAEPAMASPGGSRSRRRARAAALGLAGGLAVAAAAWGAWRWSGAGPDSITPLSLAAGRQLTFSGAASAHALSPDGRQLLYVLTGCDDRTGACEHTLTVQDIASGQSAPLLRAELVTHPGWSPDGATVVASVRSGGQEGTYLLSRLGGTPRRVGPRGHAQFSADGETLTVVGMRAREGRFATFRFRAASGAPIDSGSLALPFTTLNSFQLSPGRRWLVVSGFDASGGDVLLATPDGRVTDSVPLWPQGRVRWAPGGDALYAVMGSIGVTSWMVRIGVDARRGRFTGRVDTLFGVSRTGYGHFDLSADGRMLAYTGGTTTTTAWTLDLADSAGAPRRLAASSSALGSVALSADGALVAYMATDEVGENLYVRPFAGGAARAVTREPATAGTYQDADWYPDRRRLMYRENARRLEQARRFVWQDFPDGAAHTARPSSLLAVTLLAGGELAEQEPGGRIVYRDSTGAEVGSAALPDSLGGARLVGADTSGDGVMLVTLPPVRLVRLDRRTAAVARVGSIPAAAGLSTVFGAAASGAFYATVPPGSATGRRPTLWRTTPRTGPTRVRELPLECDRFSLRASADVRRFACTARVERPDIFLLERFDQFRR